jgi:pimeloyl-ACP methyl ester carboxylesterase
MLQAVERLLTFKPNSRDHGALNGREHNRFRFGGEFSLDLEGVWLPQSSQTTVIFIHGNRHNLTKFGDHYDLFRQLGISCLAFDFPGYGNSLGTPSEPALYASARAAYSWLTSRFQIPPSSIIIYGCSLGGAIALELAQYHKAACLITESTFTNSHDMAKHLYPYLPIQRLLPKRFQNDYRISNVNIPHLLLHGEQDPLVPVQMALRLHALAADPKQLIVVPEASHTDTLLLGGQGLLRDIGAFIERATRTS